MDYNMTSFYTFVLLVLFLSSLNLVSSRHRKLSYGGDNGDLVTNLPGQPPVDFQHYAGYVTVNETNGRALFYWFFEAMTKPEEKPLVLWLNGGPGCSSVGYGATQEIGPFLVDTDGKGIKFNNFSWNKEANMLFLESPIGVGFSYSNTTSEYAQLGDDFTGKYVPELAELIIDRNNNSSLHIDLKGILLGNPETSYGEDWLGVVDYAWSHAVISDETYKKIRRSCDFNSSDPWKNEECTQGVNEVLKQYNEIDINDIFNGWTQSKRSVIPIYKKLISVGLRIWLYSGDTDGRVPVLSTRYSLSILDLPITKQWSPWYNEKEVSGWYQEYEGLTFATFRGAGHAVPCFKPSNSLTFFTSFLLGESPPSTR
ncbi:hypothetical protein TSUD_386420 [Trifolium subterraneum]|uniref:Uncharacterized protein n=1 Tax=Trifolium subterraneum TaxID=3900 RepID=A0A2Z6MHM7_TRISU|nr:hypothetical protein TSUD_386420 [Trifolium subterraneum]